MVRRGRVRNTAGRTGRKAPTLEQREGEDGCRDRQVCTKEQVQQSWPRG